MAARTQAWQQRDTQVSGGTVSLRGRNVSEVAEWLVLDLDQIRMVYRPPNVTNQVLDHLGLDLQYFLADKVVAWVMYAFYSPKLSTDLGGYVMPAMWMYRLIEDPASVPYAAPPRPLEPPTWQGARFEVFAGWSAKLLQYPPAERTNRLGPCQLPWRPNDLNLVQVRQARVERIYGAGNLTMARSHYDVSHD